MLQKSKDEEISLENSKPELLINNETESAVVSVGNNAIVFDDGVYELTQEQISKVDEIIKSFKN